MPSWQGPGGQGRVLSVKLGGSVVTDKERPFTLRLGLLGRIAAALAAVAKETGTRYVVTLGGGSFGHVAAHEAQEAGASPAEALSVVTSVMAELAQAVADVLAMHGMRPVVYPPHAFCKPLGLRPSCSWSPVSEALRLGATPLLYGDAYPCGDGWCIVSGDELAVEAACALGASHVIYVSDVDGIYGPSGELLREVKLEEVARLATVAGRERGYDVTGGLARKIRAIRENWCAGLHGVWVVNGLRPERIRSLVAGRPTVATLVLP